MNGSVTRGCRVLFRVYAALFFLCGVAFVARPDGVIALINRMGRFQTLFGPLAGGGHRLWLVLAFSMMMMISYAAWMVSRGRQPRAFLNILLISKFASSVAYLVLLFTCERAFGYLLGSLVDGAIFVSIFIIWRRAALP